MTIARDVVPGSGFEGTAPRILSSASSAERERLLGSGGAVPLELRAERLSRQVRSFERAGYRLETQAGLQAVVVKPTTRRPLRSAMLIAATAGLYLVALLLGAGRTYHRVVISIDADGTVRLA